MSLAMCRGQAVRHGGPYAERRSPGAGHFLHLERPAEVAADILAWLARCDGPAGPRRP
jgi:pimeloyl-ACP methyl ester carboxylesterase